MRHFFTLRPGPELEWASHCGIETGTTGDSDLWAASAYLPMIDHDILLKLCFRTLGLTLGQWGGQRELLAYR